MRHLEDTGRRGSLHRSLIMAVIVNYHPKCSHGSVATGFSFTESTDFLPGVLSMFPLPTAVHFHCFVRTGCILKANLVGPSRRVGQDSNSQMHPGPLKCREAGTGSWTVCGLTLGRRQLTIHVEIGCPHLEKGVNDSCPACFTDHCRSKSRQCPEKCFWASIYTCKEEPSVI